MSSTELITVRAGLLLLFLRFIDLRGRGRQRKKEGGGEEADGEGENPKQNPH